MAMNVGSHINIKQTLHLLNCQTSYHFIHCYKSRNISSSNCQITPNLTAFLLHRLPYNEAFLREVMRKQTLLPMSVVHRATVDTELNGYFIPKVSSGINLSKASIIIRDALFNI